jgi:hypothetical protein
VHFNLAENRRDPDQPFAFRATYTTRLSAQAKAQHVPLGQALREYAGAANRDKLLSLLPPVQRAAEPSSAAARFGDELVEMIVSATFGIIAADGPPLFAPTAGIGVAVPQGAPLRRESPSDRQVA